ncbi:hypothetical protein CC80DRAFT_554299 [Byssothecium circinans]|uniref:Uncharacterized protein n=1 Tax=Byssothecium circinans TaxID=147558 RepID=A0A6A5TIB9_9PLEO|nr:hypothetical protein CC80DRAFT_554299 [Byssothecium circinans]
MCRTELDDDAEDNNDEADESDNDDDEESLSDRGNPESYWRFVMNWITTSLDNDPEEPLEHLDCIFTSEFLTDPTKDRFASIIGVASENWSAEQREVGDRLRRIAKYTLRFRYQWSIVIV